MDCCCKILKYLVFIVNFLVTLAGIGLIILGTLGMLSLKSGVAKQSDTDLSVIYWLCVVLLALGSLMTVIGFLGCCGAARESQCLLGSFSALMVIGVILTILGGVVLHQKKDEILPGIRKNIEKLYQNPNANLEAITLLQESLECCGGNDFRDFDKQDVSFPESCCRDKKKSCQAPRASFSTVPADQLYYPGCVGKAENLIKSQIDNPPIVLGIVGLIQVLAFVFSLALCCAIRNNTYKAGYRV